MYHYNPLFTSASAQQDEINWSAGLAPATTGYPLGGAAAAAARAALRKRAPRQLEPFTGFSGDQPQPADPTIGSGGFKFPPGYDWNTSSTPRLDWGGLDTEATLAPDITPWESEPDWTPDLSKPATLPPSTLPEGTIELDDLLNSPDDLPTRAPLDWGYQTMYGQNPTNQLLDSAPNWSQPATLAPSTLPLAPLQGWDWPAPVNIPFAPAPGSPASNLNLLYQNPSPLSAPLADAPLPRFSAPALHSPSVPRSHHSASARRAYSEPLPQTNLHNTTMNLGL